MSVEVVLLVMFGLVAINLLLLVVLAMTIRREHVL